MILIWIRVINSYLNLASWILNLIQFVIFHIEKAFLELYLKQHCVEAQGWGLEMSQRPASSDLNTFLNELCCHQFVFKILLSTVCYKVKFYNFSCLELPLLLFESEIFNSNSPISRIETELNIQLRFQQMWLVSRLQTSFTEIYVWAYICCLQIIYKLGIPLSSVLCLTMN